ncbi:MAG: site-specific integrase [Lactobacillus sp.]|jgi:integrase|nr:site-specific integrase [Lactobacillus sp.]MCI2033566.1 site-specific integrase [Lactobacillus sp.]
MATIRSYTLKSGQVKYEVTGYARVNKGTKQQQNYHKKGFDSAEEARDWAKRKASDLVAEKRTGRQQYNMLVKDWLTEWITKYKINVKEGSMIVYRYNVNHYIIPNVGGYTLGEYTPTVHQQFILDMLDHGGDKGKPLSYNSVSIINGTLSNAFNKAVKLHYIDSNPTVAVEYPRSVKKDAKRLHYWSVPQADTFLEAVKKDSNRTWYYFFLTVLDLDLRKGEALALTWDDIDFANNTLDISKTRLYRAEVHEHAVEIIIDDSKYPASFRTLYMTDRLRVALMEYRGLWYPTNDVIDISDGGPTIEPVSLSGKTWVAADIGEL